MKKSLCALAAILQAGAAHGQSSVTLYGVIDGSVEYVNRVASAAATPTQGGSRFDMPSVGGLSASRWGLRGVEDLGAGNKALFVLESGFQFDTGALQREHGPRDSGRAAGVLTYKRRRWRWRAARAAYSIARNCAHSRNTSSDNAICFALLYRVASFISSLMSRPLAFG